MYIYKNCQDCGKQFKGKSLRCRSCAAKQFRKTLREDPERFKSFSEKVSNNMKKQWKEDDWAINVKEKIGNTIKHKNDKLSEEERKQKYSRYYKCNKETIEKLNKKGKKQCYLNWKSGKSGFKSNMKGFFKPKNPEKYKGNPTNIVYRSSYELKLMNRLDIDPNIVEWASEETKIPYISPVDCRRHTYFPDFVVKKSNGEVLMIEVKPLKETRPPVIPKKQTKKYINEVFTWGVNQAKWKAATEYCADRKWKFLIMTENELGINF